MHLNMSSHVRRNSGDFVQGEMSLLGGPHTFARDWLAHDSAVCWAWTTMEQSGHYRTDTTLISHYVDHYWYTPTELCHRDVCRCPGVKWAPGHQQPPYWCDYGYIACQRYHITSIKQAMFERGRKVGHPSASFLLTDSPSDHDDALCDVHNL